MRIIDTANRRFQLVHHHDPADIREPPEDHPMLDEGRTRYPTTRRHPDDSPRLLISGMNNSKIGRLVQKGDWSGMPIYTLTLEERATCSRSCFMWRGCYGNSMHMARRHVHGQALEDKLHTELHQKARDHPQGFVVRLHVLGDFYSIGYVLRWHDWFDTIPQLRVFGYTHRHPWAKDDVDSFIGISLQAIKDDHPERFRMRWSGEKSVPDGATVIRRVAESAIVPEGQVCATYIDDSAACSTCAMCWSSSMKDKTIVFQMHGPVKKGAKMLVQHSARNNYKYGRANKEPNDD